MTSLKSTDESVIAKLGYSEWIISTKRLWKLSIAAH